MCAAGARATTVDATTPQKETLLALGSGGCYTLAWFTVTPRPVPVDPTGGVVWLLVEEAFEEYTEYGLAIAVDRTRRVVSEN